MANVPAKSIAKIIAKPLIEMADIDALSEMKSRPGVRNVDAIRQKAKDLYGVDLGSVHMPDVIQDNAVFIHPDASRRFKKNVLSRVSVAPDMKDKIREAASRHGMIVTGKHMKRHGVLEHEYGHAVASGNGNILERMASKPWVMNNRLYYHTIPSFATAAAIGKGGGKYGWLKGLGAGAAMGALTDSPRLYAEHSANRYAKTLLPDEMKDEVSYTKPMIRNVLQSTLPYAGIGTVAGLSSALIGKAIKA